MITVASSLNLGALVLQFVFMGYVDVRNLGTASP